MRTFLAVLYLAALFPAPRNAVAQPPRDFIQAAPSASAANPARFAFSASDPAAQTIKVWDPYEQTEITFRAVPAAHVLDALFGKAWRTGDEILVTCLDGYQPVVPVARFLKHKAWFAFAREGAAFELLKEGKPMPIGPAYLVWENIRDKKIRSEGDFGWPFQVDRLELVVFKERYAAILPPAGASARVRAGFDDYRTHCLKCHTLNGQGGKMGPELNYPLNITEYWTRAALHRWIDNPASVRWKAAMPRPEIPGPGRTATIDRIIDYLAAMKARKLKPAE